MLFQFRENETIAEGVRRIVLEQIDESIALLRIPIKKQDASNIHQARKNFKKIRGLLRLVRYELGYTVYKLENITFRDMGRSLSELRDSEVLVEVYDKMVDKFPGKISKKSRLRKSLLRNRLAVKKKFMTKEDFNHLINSLKEARARVESWPLRNESFFPLRNGVRKVYKQGLIALQNSSNFPSNESYHEFRKKAKYLWYEVRLLVPVWPAMLEALSNELHELSDILGYEHDLTLLQNYIEEKKNRFRSNDEILIVHDLINKFKNELRENAEKLGVKIYSETPYNFSDRIESYWYAWYEKEKQVIAGSTDLLISQN